MKQSLIVAVGSLMFAVSAFAADAPAKTEIVVIVSSHGAPTADPLPQGAPNTTYTVCVRFADKGHHAECQKPHPWTLAENDIKTFSANLKANVVDWYQFDVDADAK